MENRRPTTTTNPLNPKKLYDRSKENTSSTRYDRYQNRESGGDNRYQNREGGDNRYQNNRSNNNGDNRFQNRESGGDNRYQNRDSGDNRYQSREGGDNRFQNRGGSSNDRYQNRDTRPRFPSRDANNSPNRDARDSRDPRDRRDFRDNSNYRDTRDTRPSRDNFQRSDSSYAPKPGGKFAPRGRFPVKGKPLKPWQQENKVKIVSDLQITDGKLHGKYLQNSASPKMNPTSRRVREIMFKILFRRVRAGRFLDLSAGAGIIGIEAISRGAMISTMVERSSKMISFIKKNLETCAVKEGHGEIVEMEAIPFLKRMANRKRHWDVVYFNPPTESEYADVLEFLKRGAAIKPTGVLVVEHSVEMALPEKLGVLKRWRVVVQDDTALSFYEKQ